MHHFFCSSRVNWQVMAAPLRLRLAHHTKISHAKPLYKPASLFLRLPPCYRAFHASPKPQLVLETLLTSTHSLLTGIHSVTHLPWAYTIPLSALLLRLALTLPLTIYTRHAIQQRLSLQPLLAAWSHHIRNTTNQQSGHLGPQIVSRNALLAIRKKRREIYKRWGCQLWKNYLPIVSLPLWLLMIETLRGMIGTHKGLLGLFFLPGAAGSNNELDPAPELTSAGMLELDVGPELVSDDIVQAIVPVEPSLAMEGMLWFADLTAPDPMLLLPFMLSASMFLNMFSGKRRGIPGVEMTVTRTRILRALGILALAAGPLTLQAPSGILLYWVSSSMMGYVQGQLIDLYMPIKPPVKPCDPKKVAIKLQTEKLSVNPKLKSL